VQIEALVIAVGSRSCEVFVEGRGELRCTLRGSLFKTGDPGAGPTGRRKADGRLVGGRRETGRARDARHGGDRAGKRDIAAERPVAVGDRVRIVLQEASGAPVEGVVESVLPRRSVLVRASPDDKAGRVHVLAANIDRLVIVAAMANPPLREGLIDRFLVEAALQDLPPVVVLNKVDIADATDAAGRPVTRTVVDPYKSAGLAVLETSCVTGEGIPQLRDFLTHGTSLVVGHSGVGKSSLINAVSPGGLQQRVGEVAEYHGRGKHTTTVARLLRLSGTGGWLVDSPGLREFGLDDVAPSDLARLFPGFGEWPDSCRFSDCRHRAEPGCAVLAAVERGELARDRHATYLRVLEETEAAPKW
jgi:ribosome biogenesis GTPase